MTTDYTISIGDGWTAITAIGESCTAWKKFERDNECILVKHSDDGIPTDEDGATFLMHPANNKDHLFFSVQNADDILYAKLAYGPDSQTLTVDDGGHIGKQNEIDPTTGSLLTILQPAHKINEGDNYFISGFQVVDDTDDITFGVTTPDTDVTAHVTTLINATSQIEIYIYEAATFSGGTPVAPFNSNRNSAKTSVMLLSLAPTVTDDGDLLSSQSSGKAGVNLSKAEGGLNSREFKLLLKRNTKYIFRTISRDDGNIISFRADWSEHISNA
jgi:hypothetical protein